MKQIPINVPGGLVTYNYLYENMPIEWREEDLLFVKLPNGKVIDVGWYPACDPKGNFKITLSDSDQNELTSKSVLALNTVADLVERTAKEAVENIDRRRNGV